GDYIRLADIRDLVSKDSFTIEVWFKTTDKYRVWQRIFETSVNNGSNATISVGFDGNSGNLFIGYPTNSGYMTQTVTSVIIDNNTWHHIAYVKNGSDIEFYLNGSLITTLNNVVNIRTGTSYYDNAPFIFRLGASSYGDQSFLGQMKELRMWKKALSADIIQNNMNVTVPFNSADLYYYLPLSSRAGGNLSNNSKILYPEFYLNLDKRLQNESVADSASQQWALMKVLSPVSQAFINSDAPKLGDNNVYFYGTYKDTLVNSININYQMTNQNNIVSNGTALTGNNFWYAKLIDTNYGRFIPYSTNRIFKPNYITRVDTPIFYYTQREYNINFGTGGSIKPFVNNQGDQAIFKIISGNPAYSFITIDSISGVIAWKAQTPNSRYKMPVKASNIAGSRVDTVIFNVTNITDYISQFSNSGLELGTTGAVGYVRLPNLDSVFGKSFTVETWFKSNVAAPPQYSRIIDFSTLAPPWEGLIFNFYGTNQIQWVLQSNHKEINYPTGYDPTDWHYYAITYDHVKQKGWFFIDSM
ncbi:MAG: LamG domain-containing protein, partial [Sediminibacterium sp.]|nr:LamG domain-containing protein [Sediminibacterium sp.]